MSWDLYDHTAVGDPIEVDYAADAPRYHLARTNGDAAADWFFAIGGLATVLLPLGFLAGGAVQRVGADLGQLRRRVRSGSNPLG